MPYVVTLEGFRPPPRYDSESWTSAIIEEAAASTGPWTQVETVVLVPDADPSRPAERDFTTDNASLATGWYRVIFRDAQDDSSAPSDPVYAGTVTAHRASLEEAAAYIRARTRTPTGQELGTFSTDTRPTDTEMQPLLDKGARDVLRRTGTIPDLLLDDARDMAALRAAMIAELTYFPEQVTTGRSNYEQLKQLWDEGIEQLVKAVEEANAGEEPGGPSVESYGPYYYFGSDTIIGTETVW